MNYAKICGEQDELLRTYDSAEPINQRLEINSINWTDSAYVAAENSGQAVGFFCYSVNPEDNIGFFKFIIVDKTKRLSDNQMSYDRFEIIILPIPDFSLAFHDQNKLFSHLSH